jgi:hypothetical protein
MSTRNILVIVLPVVVLVLGLTWQSNSNLVGLVSGVLHKNDPTPKFIVFSHDPFVVYVKNFVEPEEAAHLVDLASVFTNPSP